MELMGHALGRMCARALRDIPVMIALKSHATALIIALVKGRALGPIPATVQTAQSAAQIATHIRTCAGMDIASAMKPVFPVLMIAATALVVNAGMGIVIH